MLMRVSHTFWRLSIKLPSCVKTQCTSPHSVLTGFASRMVPMLCLSRGVNILEINSNWSRCQAWSWCIFVSPTDCGGYVSPQQETSYQGFYMWVSRACSMLILTCHAGAFWTETDFWLQGPWILLFPKEGTFPQKESFVTLEYDAPCGIRVDLNSH